MPLPHDYNEWANAKADKTAAFKKQKEEAKKSRGRSALAKEAKPNAKALLALGKKMMTALITQHHMSQTEA
jgi:hypothetical protein